MATTSQTPLAGPSRPIGSPDIPQVFLPTTSKKGTYSPRLYAAATVHFKDRKRKVDERRRVAYLLPLSTGVRSIDWDAAQPTKVTPEQLLKDPGAAAPYLPLPAGAMQLKTFTSWAKHFDRWLARTQRVEVPASQEPVEPLTLAPKRGGVSVELVAIAWDLE